MYHFDLIPLEHVELQNWGNMPHKPMLMTIYHITSNIKKIVQQLMFMIKCLNGFVINLTDKINYLGHIIDHGDDDCLSKHCGF